MDSHDHSEQAGQAEETLLDFTGQIFDQTVSLSAPVQQSPTPTFNFEDLLTDSTLVQQSQSCENVVSTLTRISLSGIGTLDLDDSVLDHIPQPDMLDSDFLGRASPFSDTQWVFLPGVATFTQDHLQRMEPLVLPQSSFRRQEISLIDQHEFTLSMSGFAPYSPTVDLEHTGVYAEMQDIFSTGCIALPILQNTSTLSPRLLEAERHIDPRSVANLVDETMRGAHREPFPVTSVPSSSAGLTAPSTQSALSSSSRGSRRTRRSLNDLMSPDALHDTRCPVCSKYYSRSELMRHRRCHGTKRIRCSHSDCDKLFLDKKEEERHYQKTGHGGPGFRAETIYCQWGSCAGKRVSRKDNIKRHKDTFHPGWDRAASDSASVADAPSFSHTGSL